MDAILDESRRARDRWREQPAANRQSPPHDAAGCGQAPDPPRPSSSEEAAHRVLGVKPSATLDDIKGDHRRLAQIHHPDRNPDDPQAKVRMQAINDARDTLRRSHSGVRF